MSVLPLKLADMVAELKEIDELSEKYEVLIEMGKEVLPIADEYKIESCLVHGCQSQVHVWAELDGDKVSFKGYADAMIVNGLLSFFVIGCSGMSVKGFLELDPSYIKETGVVASLTPSRVNGFYNIHQKYLAQIKALQESSHV